MTVRELVTRLCELQQDLEVLCYTEDQDLLRPRLGFTLLEITGVSVVDAEKCRVEERPYLKLKKTPHSQKHALIEITGDF